MAAEPEIAGGGSALAGGGGYLIVGDVEHGTGTLLLWTPDGRSWEQRATFPDPPCCGG